MKILTVNNKAEEKFLRQKTADFDFAKFTKKEIKEIIERMKETMLKANGIGLSANQIGLNFKMFVVLIPEKPSLNTDSVNTIGKAKFYAVFNPEIVKFSKKTSVMEEGCLSVPGVYGEVERPEKITLIGQDKNGKKIKIKAEGLLARVFQHEVDHLNGILFTDRTKNIKKVEDRK
jgi:peptide deformylase